MKTDVRQSRKKLLLISKFIVLSLLAISVLVFIGCKKETSSTTTTTTEPDIEKITISAITISSSQIVLGDTVTLAVNVLNSGTNTVQDYPVSLRINDSDVEKQMVTILTGETKTIAFQYKPEKKGNYRADINGQTTEFEAVREASFVIGEINVDPLSPVAGQEITISEEISNEGDIPGSYTAIFKLDGQVIHTEEVRVDAGQTATVTTNYSASTGGVYLIEFADVSKSIKVFKPAEFEVVYVDVEPDSIYLGDTVKISATITNSGETKGTYDIPLVVDGETTSTESVVLEPGGNTIVSFSVTPDTVGSIDINILEKGVTLNVKKLEIYTNAVYFYTISYPPGYDIDMGEAQTVAIGSGSSGITVLVDWVSTASSPDDYFNDVAEGKETQLPDWTYDNKTALFEDGEKIGYRYDYSNTVNGKKWIGKGLMIKKGGLGFYVVFTTYESEWAKNESLAVRCLDSFKLPVITTGSYANDENGIAFSVANEWTAIDTDVTVSPVILIAPYQYQYQIMGQLVFEPVGSQMTVQEYAEELVSRYTQIGFQLISKGPFQFANSIAGYESVVAAGPATDSYKIRSISVNSGSRMYSILYIGNGGDIDSLSNSITQMTKTLVLSAPGMAGLNKNETLFLLEGEVPTLDPALSEEAPNGIVGAVFSGLVRIDKELQPVPDLAERWTVSDDGKTYTFYLNKNAKFHSGKQVTADDVKYSWERACDPALESPKASYFLNDIVGAKDRLDGKAAQISGIKVIDDYTLEVTIDTPKQYFVQKLSQVVTFVVDEDNIKQGEDWYKEPNGTGPFKLKSWVEDSQIVLERFDDFYDGPVKLKNIVFKLFAGLPMTLYESGEIDMTGVPTSDLDRVLDTSNPLNKELNVASLAVIRYVGLNVTKPPFDDPKVREAFALALDVNKLIEVTQKGQSERAAGYIPSGIPGYNDSLQPIPYDVEKAKQLIAESKYGSVGNLPQITLYTLYGTTSLQQAIIGMWQQNLGVQVRVETISEIETYFTRMRNDEFHVYVSGWVADYIDPQNFLDVLFQSESSENNFAYSNPEVDAALVLAAAETDHDTRIRMYQDIEALILTDLPVIPLTQSDKNYVLVKPYVKGYTLLPISTNALWREIYLEAH